MSDRDRYLGRRRKGYLRRLGIRERASEVHFARTTDGWHVALSRYGSRRSRRFPVMFCHGLGSNRFTWDLDPEVSLATHLAEEGYDVFSLELRGHGRSQKRGPGFGRWGWSTYEYAERDFPAALEAVCELSGAPAVHVIGHSMGGILLHARRAVGDPRIASGVTIASSLDYTKTPSVFHSIKGLSGLASVLPVVPLGPMTRFLAPIALAFDNPIDRVNVHPGNVDRALYRRLCAVAFHGISGPVLASLADAMEAGGMRDSSGVPLKMNVALEGPRVLAIAGTADPQCHPKAALRLCHDLLAFGREHGHAEDYGHFDLVMGLRARSEVWPAITSWLGARDDEAPIPPAAR
ncbi:MAG: alpha/beta fold hydrolase [Myxococcota bacterium]